MNTETSTGKPGAGDTDEGRSETRSPARRCNIAGQLDPVTLNIRVPTPEETEFPTVNANSGNLGMRVHYFEQIGCRFF